MIGRARAEHVAHVVTGALELSNYKYNTGFIAGLNAAVELMAAADAKLHGREATPTQPEEEGLYET